MRAAPFDYHRPDSLDAALALLDELDDARILAGGQSLIPLMNLRLARPRHLVDINRIPALSALSVDGAQLRIGALVRHHELERSPLVAAHAPMLAAAAAVVGDRQIRARGTIGGSLAHADPAAELPAALIALDGRVVVRRRRGTRVIAADDLFVTYLTTRLEPDEILVEVQVPVLARGMRWGFHELKWKPAGFAVAACGAVVTEDDRGRCVAARLAVAGAASTPVRVPAAEQALVGQVWTSVIDAAAESVYSGVDPDSDVHASAEYRRTIARLCARRALQQAANRVGTT